MSLISSPLKKFTNGRRKTMAHQVVCQSIYSSSVEKRLASGNHEILHWSPHQGAIVESLYLMSVLSDELSTGPLSTLNIVTRAPQGDALYPVCAKAVDTLAAYLYTFLHGWHFYFLQVDSLSNLQNIQTA